jgi:hypothetical protein
MGGSKDDSGAPVGGGRRCGCGHDRRHPLVRPEYTYGALGALVLGLFGSPAPARIDYVCTDCGEVVDSVTDKETLGRFRHREPLPRER